MSLFDNQALRKKTVWIGDCCWEGAYEVGIYGAQFEKQW